MKSTTRLILVALAAYLAADYMSTAWAGAAFTDVWYPDGKIRYYINPTYNDTETVRSDGKTYTVVVTKNIDPKLAPTIRTAMAFIAAHTPLDPKEVTNQKNSNLEFRASFAAPDGGGYTFGYWSENRSDTNKVIRFDPVVLPNTAGVAHEFGHALGFVHEFQRPDRDTFVSVCDNPDPFNYSKLGSAYWPDPYHLLSPFDYASVMNDGYLTNSCPGFWKLAQPHVIFPPNVSSSRKYDNVNNIVSIHDINSIYRMYGDNLGTNDDGDRFGAAVATGDYDDDGYQDIVVANLQSGGLWLSFFRGVGTNDSDSLANLPGLSVEHVKWAPWFKEKIDGNVASDEKISLATGDFNGDGIDDLAVGQPGYDGGRGRVSILFVNTLPSDSGKSASDAAYAPWGRKGIQYTIHLDAHNVGFYDHSPKGQSPYDLAPPQFGTALAAVRATAAQPGVQYDDLVIGAPGAKSLYQSSAPSSAAVGAVIVIKGSLDKSPGDFVTSTRVVIWNPQTDANQTEQEFGAAIARLPGLCALKDQKQTDYNDFFAVGAPGLLSGRGVVHIFGCATASTGNTLVLPPLEDSIVGSAAGYRFGQALAGFRIRFRNDIRKTFLAIGQPRYVADDGAGVGRVILNEISSKGKASFVSAFSPKGHAGKDEFGYALAVQQRPYAYEVLDEPGSATYIGVGMPGAEVKGVRAGTVFVWRPFNADGSVDYTTFRIPATDPNSKTDTRFGESIATLRTMQWEGGFVAGAPDAITVSDNKQAGTVTILENKYSSSIWKAMKTNLNQETEGDMRPTN